MIRPGLETDNLVWIDRLKGKDDAIFRIGFDSYLPIPDNRIQAFVMIADLFNIRCVIPVEILGAPFCNFLGIRDSIGFDYVI